jgi:hypothetical protein
MRHRAFVVAVGSAVVLPLTACAPAAMGPVTYFADPGQYQYFSCALLAERRKFWTERELEIKLLMDKAEQGSGCAFVNVIAYKGPHCCSGRNQGDRCNASR